MADKKKLHIENRRAPRYNPEPKDAEKALFFKNEINIKFSFDEVEREVTDLSESGLKVYVDDHDPLIEHMGQTIKALLTLKDKTIQIMVHVVHQTEDDYGLGYTGCRFEKLSQKELKVISTYLKSKQDEKG